MLLKGMNRMLDFWSTSRCRKARRCISYLSGLNISVTLQYTVSAVSSYSLPILATCLSLKLSRFRPHQGIAIPLNHGTDDVGLPPNSQSVSLFKKSTNSGREPQYPRFGRTHLFCIFTTIKRLRCNVAKVSVAQPARWPYLATRDISG